MYVLVSNKLLQSAVGNFFFKVKMNFRIHPTVILFIILLLKYTEQCQVLDSENPETITKYGPVRGSRALSRKGKTFYAFRGMPYAKPPIGDLRFKAPVPPNHWKKTWDATKDGPVCIQKNYLFANPEVEGQEDCLYINVYAPKNAQLLPVMVFIHWGGFLAGRGTSDFIGPEYLMDKNIVLVTFNYRLGPMGFLTTLDDVAPGNYALKDQVLALKWVQENIINFGGDKSNVTIFGQSAGAGSVHYHILSPQSRGLFHRAISQSGSALSLWAALGNSVQGNVLKAQANFVGCGEHLGSSQEVISCLRNVSAYDLVQSQDKFKTFHVDPITVYTSVKEQKTVGNAEPFLTKYPIEYIQEKEFANVPWIMGVVEDEGLLKAEGLLRQSETRKDLNADFENVLTNTLLLLSSSTNDTKDLYNGIRDQYLLGNDYVNVSDPESIEGFIDLYSDRAFYYGSYQSAMLHSAKGHSPIWFYQFKYRGQYTYGELFASTNETLDFKWGVSHCDDLLYLFRSPGLVPDLKKKIDLAMIEVMTDLWTSFAIHGDPNFSRTLNSSLLWSPLRIRGLKEMKNANFCSLEMNGSHYSGYSLNTSCGFYKERMQFWSSRPLNENFEGLQ